MNNKHLCALILALALGALAISCADSESRMPLGGATAIIKLGHSDAVDKALAPGAPLAASETLPPFALFDRVMVTVSGPDIGTIQKNFPYSDTISMDVPAGAVRRFEVTVFVAPFDPDNFLTWTAASTFKGTSTANVPAGATVSVPVMMILDETKFVIPDYLNNRIVQFSTIPTALATWVPATSTNPVDIDFDARGRIYVLNKSVLSGYDMIYRSETIMTTGTQVLDQAYFPNLTIRAFTIDRRRNILYLANYDFGIDIISVDLSQSLPAMEMTFLNTVDPSTYNPYFSDITAMDVGNDGMLTIIGNDYNANQIMMRYNPFMSELVCSEGCHKIYGFPVGAPFDFSSLYITPKDVQVRGQDVCVLTQSDMPGFVLLQFQATPAGFVLGTHFGTIPSIMGPPEKNFFYGPQQFAIRRENLLVVIDEGSYYDMWNHGVDRLVLTDFDIARPWTTFGRTGSGDGQFNFYAYC